MGNIIEIRSAEMDEHADDRDPQSIRKYRVKRPYDAHVDPFRNFIDRVKEQERKKRRYLNYAGALKIDIDRDRAFSRLNKDNAVGPGSSR